ncbi:MAG: alanyl-tRNA editing protein [Polyangiaceae bacterium]|nr:alanyl-tRNA editing protein [Polyangiaceae bacterium]
MTERLYYHDSLRLDFDARVVDHARFEGRNAVVLDRTAFYPESGGQMADRGRLATAPVLDVQVDGGDRDAPAGDRERIVHVLEGKLPEIGTVVIGEVDRARRRVHMALHTAQHMLSRALTDVARTQTVSSRLGETTCTVDVDAAELDERSLARAEDLVNALVDDDLEVRAWFPDAGELARLPLRKAPTVDGAVRLVRIGDFDLTPCGGTHCTRTSQVGSLHVTGVERYKGGTRISFVAGRRARDRLAAESQVLGAMARELTCAPEDVPGALEKLRRQLQESREAAGKLQARLAELEAGRLEAEQGSRELIVASVEGAGPELLRALASRLVRPDRAVLLAGERSEGMALLAARGAASSVDCGALVRRLVEAAGGRGGGRPERAEGKLPPDAAFAELVSRALSASDG